MTNAVFQKIIKDTKKHIIGLAKKNGWVWFYNIHYKKVFREAEKLLKLYPKADGKIVVVACWLHDITKYEARNVGKELKRKHKTHHLDGYKFSKKFLSNYGLGKDEIELIAQCVLRHRNKPSYKVRTLEEKIVAVADTLSHFTSILYILYFKYYPDDSVEKMVKANSEKIENDWRDLALLPKARGLVRKEYEVLKRLHENYNK